MGFKEGESTDGMLFHRIKASPLTLRTHVSSKFFKEINWKLKFNTELEHLSYVVRSECFSVFCFCLFVILTQVSNIEIHCKGK